MSDKRNLLLSCVGSTSVKKFNFAEKNSKKRKMSQESSQEDDLIPDFDNEEVSFCDN